MMPSITSISVWSEYYFETHFISVLPRNQSVFYCPVFCFSSSVIGPSLFGPPHTTTGDSCLASVCAHECVRVCFLRFGMIYTTPHSINSSMTAQTCLCAHMLVWGIRLTEAHRQNSVDLLIDGGLSLFFRGAYTHTNTHTHISHSCLYFLLVPFI